MSNWKDVSPIVKPDWKSESPLVDSISAEDMESLSSYAKSFGLGAAQGASMGFADEAEAGLRSLFEGESYDQLLKDVRERYKKAEEAHDVISFLGNITGGVGSMLVGGAALKGLGLAGKTAAGARGAGEAAGLAEGITAAVPSLETGAMAIAKPTLAKSVGMSAGTGAIASAGTSEASLKDSPGELLKDVGYGAAAGAALGFGGDLLGKLIGGVGKEAKAVVTKGATGKHIVEDFISGVEHGKSGKTALGESKNRLEDLRGVSGDLISKINSVGDSIKDKYKSFYSKADELVQIDANELAVPIAEASSALQKKGYVAPQARDVVAKVFSQVDDNISDLAKRNNGKISPSMISDEMRKLQEEYSAVAGEASLRHEADAYLQIKTSMSKWLDNKLGPNLSGELSDINNQYKTLSNLRARFGIDKHLESMSGSQEGQEANIDLVKNLTQLFKKALVNDDASLDLDAGLGMLKKLDSKIASEAEGKILEASKAHSLASRLGEESPLAKFKWGAGGHASERSLTSLFSYEVGKATGAVSKGISNTVTAPIRLAQDISDVVSSNTPEIAREPATKMMQSTSENARKFGKTLLQIINQKDLPKRKALMYNMSQQPAYKEALKSIMEGEHSVVGTEE